ncbi:MULTISPECIES: SDR family oxidoreductase [Citricoccus]
MTGVIGRTGYDELEEIMDLGLKGRTALVCASTKGLGWASAQALAAEGVRVAVNGRDHARAEAKAAELGESAIGIGGDLTTADGAVDLARQALKELDHIDILVLNGPGPHAGPAVGQGTHDVREALESLVVAPEALMQELLPGMQERRWGRIVLISSSSVVAPLDNLALSNMGRPALVSVMKTLATEVASDGVTLNAVLPGRIATDRVRQVDESTAQRRGVPAEKVLAESVAKIPAGRLGRPEEIAAAVAYLSSEQSAFVTGTTLRVDGGMVPVL